MKQLREGYTTGSCAAAASFASVLWQTSGKCPEWVELEVPAGKLLHLEIQAEEAYTCGVQKDGGDDPDETNGCLVTASVEILPAAGAVQFRAGTGVGTITRKGLKLPVGEPAINPVPRQMIEKAVRSVIGDDLRAQRGSDRGKNIQRAAGHYRRDLHTGYYWHRPPHERRSHTGNPVSGAVHVPAGVRHCLCLCDGLCGGVISEAAVSAGKSHCALQQLSGLSAGLCRRTGLYPCAAGRPDGKAGEAGSGYYVSAQSHCRRTAGSDLHPCGTCRSVPCTGAAAVSVQHHTGHDGTAEQVWHTIAEKVCENCMRRTHGKIQVGLLLLDENDRILAESSQTDSIRKAWLTCGTN